MNNLSTGASGTNTFTIPSSVKQLYLYPSVAGLLFETFGATGATNTGTNAAPLSASGLNGPFRPTVGPGVVVSVYNAAGGIVTTRVYSAPSS